MGSGKTFAGIARGLKFSAQPKKPGTLYGARGLCGAISYPVLKDVVIPQFMEMVEGTGLLLPGDRGFIRSEKKAVFKNGAEILFRSLDEPNRIRGVELSWFFIDEGRHLSREAWDILIGRLRQPGYMHAGWVCSTPNGYDWMWQAFHPDSPHQLDDSVWYGADTYANARNLPETYVKSLEATYEGKFFEQEVLGRFVGILSGAVFPHWDSAKYVVDVEYDPSLPLYSFWDFGVGDLGVVEFAQIAHREKRLLTGDLEWVPELRFIGTLEHRDWGAAEWAEAWRDWLEVHCDGRLPDRNIGDPAGKQRTAATGTSVIDALGAQGVPVQAAPKRAPDYGVLILDNMMAGGRVLADRVRCPRLGAALSTHKWNTDDQGNRIGTTPVHDWTSHFAAAARYGASALLSYHHRRTLKPEESPPGPGTMGYLVRQLLAPKEAWLGQEAPRIEWQPVSVLSPQE